MSVCLWLRAGCRAERSGCVEVGGSWGEEREIMQVRWAVLSWWWGSQWQVAAGPLGQMRHYPGNLHLPSASPRHTCLLTCNHSGDWRFLLASSSCLSIALAEGGREGGGTRRSWFCLLFIMAPLSSWPSCLLAPKGHLGESYETQEKGFDPHSGCRKTIDCRRTASALREAFTICKAHTNYFWPTLVFGRTGF